jgi:putative CocE/NonD family hydrolase
MGLDEWRGYPDFPPPSQPERLYLAANHTLAAISENAPPDTYRYDPSNPTPAVGGAQFALQAGMVDNQKFAQRPDVLVYTSPPLTAPVEIIGQVNLELYVNSSQEHTDFYGRLCDVYPDGRVINICDGLSRVHLNQLTTTCATHSNTWDQVCCVHVDLWFTAYHFRTGHRLQLIVGSGAHPRWNRHTGTADTLRDAKLQTAEQTIYHDADHPSALVLPVVHGSVSRNFTAEAETQVAD